jgi:hypothetical protein
MFWTASGKCLIAWDMGQGPTWGYDPLGDPIKGKFLGECEVWRAQDPENTGQAAVCIGETKAEAFLDTSVSDGAVYYYWVMERMASGGLRQVGPLFDVEMPLAWDHGADDSPPTDVDDLVCRAGGAGNLLSWLPSVDTESGLLAYFIYDSNQDQPDSVVWANDDVQEGSQRRDEFLDRSDDGAKGYVVRAIDCMLNLSEGVGPVVPTALRRNLVVNPELAVNITDGWALNNCTRDASPPVALPDGCAAAIHFAPPDASDRGNASVYFTLDPATRLYWVSFYLYRPGGYRTRVYAGVYTPTGEIGIDIYDGAEDDAGFVRRYQGIAVPDDATDVLFSIFSYDNAVGRDSWLTGFMIEPDYTDSDDPGDFADGDTAGWEWDGEAHNSASREA